MRGLVGNFLLVSLAFLLLVPPTGWAGGAGRATPPPATGDWVVSDTTAITGGTINLNGSLVVRPGGALTLTGATLVLNCSYPGQFRIEVMSGGELRFVQSGLAAANRTRGYLFWAQPDSVLELTDSSVRNAGTAESPDGSTNGLLVRTDTATLHNTTFSDCFQALHFRNCSASVSDCAFFNNRVGVVADRTALVLSGCLFADGTASGVSLYNGTVATISGCNFTRNFRYGVYVNRSSADVISTEFWRNYLGFHAEYTSTAQVRNCLFEAQIDTGLRFWYCPRGRISDCRVNNSGSIALFVVGSRVDAFNTTFCSSVYHAYLYDGALGELVNCTISRYNLYFGDSTSQLNISWFLNVRVQWWSDMSAVPGAAVKVTNRTGSTVFSGLTGPQGALDMGVVPGYIVNRRSYAHLGPYSVSATKGGLAAYAQADVNSSMDLRILLDNIGPAIQVEEPAPGAFVNSSALVLRGIAWDNETLVSRIEVSIDNGSFLAANGSSSWSFAAILSDGQHRARIRGTDTANNTNIVEVSFIVDTTAPALCITSPEPGNVTKDPVVMVAGHTDPYGNVTLSINGAQVPYDNVTGAFGVAVNLTEGDNLIPVTAADLAGNVARIDVLVRLDTMVSPFDIYPAGSAATNNSPVWIHGTVEPGITLIIGRLDAGGNLTDQVRVNVTDGNLSVNYTVFNGTNRLRIDAFDAYGNSLNREMNITYDRIPPLLNLTSPPGPEYYTKDRRLVLSGRIEPGATLMVNGRQVLYEGDGFNRSVTLDPGANQFVLTAVDPAGNQRTIALTAVLDRTPPYLRVKAPRDGSRVTTGTVQVRGTTEQCATITVNGISARVDLSGGFKKEVPLRMGHNSLDIIAYDRAGNPATVHLVLERVAPAPLLEDWQLGLVVVVALLCAFAGVVAWDTHRTTGKWGLRRPGWLRVPDRIKSYMPRPTFGREEFESGPGAVQAEPGKEGREPQKAGAPPPPAPAQPAGPPAGGAQPAQARLGDEFIVSQKPLSAQPANMPAATELPAQLPVAEPAPQPPAAAKPAGADLKPPEPAAAPQPPPAAPVAPPPAGAPAPAAPAPAAPPKPPEPKKPVELDPLAEILGAPTKKV